MQNKDGGGEPDATERGTSGLGTSSLKLSVPCAQEVQTLNLPRSTWGHEGRGVILMLSPRLFTPQQHRIVVRLDR